MCKFKNFLLMIAFVSFFSSQTSAQIEGGDKELLFSLSYYSLVGSENSNFSLLNGRFSFGYFFTPNFQISLGPNIVYNRLTQTTTGSFGEERESVTEFVDISASLAFNVNFLTASKTVPYLSFEWYQQDFDPEGQKFIDASNLTFGFGLRNFFNKYAALNTSARYGFTISSASEGGILVVETGVSVFL